MSSESQTIAVVATSDSRPKVSTVSGSSNRVIRGQISEPKIARTITTTSAAANEGTSISGMIAAAPQSVSAWIRPRASTRTTKPNRRRRTGG